MGPSETAITIPGALEKLRFLTEEEMRERMAADFEDSSMRDELLSFHRAAMALRNDPAVLSCFRSGRDEPGLPWITETSRAMHCYLRDTDELPERAVLAPKPKRAAGDKKRVPLRERMAAARGN